MIKIRVCILVQITIYRRLQTSRDGHLDQSEARTYRYLYENTDPALASVQVLIFISTIELNCMVDLISTLQGGFRTWKRGPMGHLWVLSIFCYFILRHKTITTDIDLINGGSGPNRRDLDNSVFEMRGSGPPPPPLTPSPLL